MKLIQVREKERKEKMKVNEEIILEDVGRKIKDKRILTKREKG